MSFRSARNCVKFGVRFLVCSLPFLRKILFAFAEARQGKARCPFLLFSCCSQRQESAHWQSGRWWTSSSAEPPLSRSHKSPLSPNTLLDRKSTRLNSSHANISYAVFCLKNKKTTR